jgi:hypothetical protein
MTLAAWVLKTITLRVGGSKLYERTDVPAAIGFIIGIAVVTVIGGALLVKVLLFILGQARRVIVVYSVAEPDALSGASMRANIPTCRVALNDLIGKIS